jgi:Flp pilus assembly protein CpaB
VPELAVGMLVIVLFAIGGLLWHLRSIERTPTLAISKPVERGEVIGADDLRVVYVASGDPLAALRPSESSRIVGTVALVDLAPGLVVTDDVVAEAAPIGDDEGVVGLPLEPGQYPAFDLAPGDRVDIVRIGGAGSAPDSEDRTTPAIVVPAVEVIAVADLVGGERKLVTLRTSHEDAATIGSLDSASVRLVQVSA